MWVLSANLGLGDLIGAVLANETFTDDPSFPLEHKYIAIRPLHNYFAFLSVASMPGLNNGDASFGTLPIYFLGMLVQPIAIWTIEASRKRNMLTPISMYISVPKLFFDYLI